MTEVIPEKDLVVLGSLHADLLNKARLADFYDAPHEAGSYLKEARRLAFHCLPKEEVKRRTYAGFYGQGVSYDG